MFGLNIDKGPKPKCFFTESPLPTYLNHNQPPRKKQPFATILKHPSAHTLQLLLPSTSRKNFTDHLPALPPYSLLSILPSALLSDPILQTLKTPSPTPPLLITQSNTLTLSPTGTLTLTLPKAIYQRTGLHGIPTPSPGVKHSKNIEEFTISIDVRAPNFLPGKKGFERVKWAFEKVLDGELGLLKCLVLNPGVEWGGEVREVAVKETEMMGAKIAGFEGEEGDEGWEEEVLEWIGLCLLGSERVREGDEVDGLFSRYVVPGAEEGRVEDLARVRFTGLMGAETVLQVLLAAWRTGGWFAVSVQGFEGGMYTVLKTDMRTLLWEYD